MKHLINTVFLSISLVTAICGQHSINRNEVGISIGIQNPNEFELLNFASSGSDDSSPDVFKVGASIGLYYEYNRRWLGLHLASHYHHNRLRSIPNSYEYLEDLQSSYNRALLTLKVFNRKKINLRLGAGLGAQLYKEPDLHIFYDFVTDDGETDAILEGEFSFTAAACSSILITIPINDQFNFKANTISDLVLFYGDVETALLWSTNIGLSYTF